MACTVCVNNDDKPVKMVSDKYFVKHKEECDLSLYIIMTYLPICLQITGLDWTIKTRNN